MIIGFITGAPIAGILALAGLLYFVITGEAPITTVPSAMQYGVSSFVLLAVPFFMVAGTLMEVTGMARRMIDMVQEWVGHWTGGLLVAEVVAMYVFSGLSGSKAADIATVGGVMKAPLRALRLSADGIGRGAGGERRDGRDDPAFADAAGAWVRSPACRSVRCSSPDCCRPRSWRWC